MVAPEPLSPPGDARPAPPRGAARILRGRLAQAPPPEPLTRRFTHLALLALLLIAFTAFTRQFHARAHHGADQNAYLVSAKRLAQHADPALTPHDPYAFVGRMWIQSPADGRFRPKYPPGLPLLLAATIKLAGPNAAYLVSPVCTTLALLALFLLTRQLAGSFAALLAVAILAASPVTLALTNNPNSHAPALAVVLWGAYFLFQWWQHPTFWRAACAGLLLGYAATVRYSEALLLLPLVLVILFNLHPRRPRSWLQAATLLATWALPLAATLFYNHHATGQWTGYDSTNESLAFSWEHFQRNWEIVLRQLHHTALFLTLPFGLLGLLLLFATNWKLALVLCAWLLPPTLLYTAYYWSPDTQSTAYLRFFLTALPPIAIAAAWLLTHLTPPNTHPRATAIAATLLVTAAAAWNLHTATPALAAEHHRATVTAQAATKLTDDIQAPPNSVVFAPREILHHLQFIADYRLYPTDQFTRRHIQSLAQADADPNSPTSLQPQRAAALYTLLKDHSDADLAALARTLATDALHAGHRVFLLTQLNSREGLSPATFAPAATPTTRLTWPEPTPPSPPKWHDPATPTQWQWTELTPTP